MEKSALEGVRIADFSMAWAGPYATTMLAFMGAEVIKIESRQRIDATRISHSLSHPADLDVNQGQSFHQLNPNKLSVTLNLRKPEAIELARKIVAISDIVTENFRPGVMDRLGLGYSVLKEVKPNVIMLSSSARGATGPERQYIGYAPQQGSVGGLAHLIGYSDSIPNVLHGNPDLECATMLAFAALAALHHRSQTGQGQYVDLAQPEALVCLTGDVIMDYTMNGRVRSRDGNYDDIMAPHNCYRCRGEDKWVSIAVSTEEEWTVFCEAMGNPEWANEERFGDMYARWRNRKELDALVEKWTTTHTHYEVMEILQGAGVPAMPCFNSEELFKDRHLKDRGVFAQVMEGCQSGKGEHR
ncbi:CaiB/BaiF CoA transferase family protein, partial [Thermodesulfobacteriota bacterium]